MHLDRDSSSIVENRDGVSLAIYRDLECVHTRIVDLFQVESLVRLTADTTRDEELQLALPCCLQR